MPPQINAKGQWVEEYAGPYGGLNVQVPESLLADNESPALSNFLLRNSELRSLPVFTKKFDTPNNGQILGITSFRDVNGIFHTVIWQFNKIFQYNPATPPPPWDDITGSTQVQGPYPVAYRSFANILWYTNVNQFFSSDVLGHVRLTTHPFLAYWDGITAGFIATQTQYDASVTQSAAGIAAASSAAVSGTLAQFYSQIGGPRAGPLAIGAQYLGELNNQLILANVSMRDQATGDVFSMPNLVWWSANGLPLEWDPTHNTSAGFNALLDVSDQITGLATLGVAGYLFRNAGISQFSPSGSAVAPFQFNHMWASEHGIGSVLPWSIAQYGPQAAFVAEDNVYSLTLTNASPIGGGARDAIMRDVAANSGIDPSIQQRIPVGAIIPRFSDGYVYLSYELSIPLPQTSGGLRQRIYNYSFAEKYWEVWDIPKPNLTEPKLITAQPNYV